MKRPTYDDRTPTIVHTDGPTPENLRLVLGLLRCASRAQLRAAWLELTEDQRRSLRPNRAVGQHAWNLILRDKILEAASR